METPTPELPSPLTLPPKKERNDKNALPSVPWENQAPAPNTSAHLAGLPWLSSPTSSKPRSDCCNLPGSDPMAAVYTSLGFRWASGFIGDFFSEMKKTFSKSSTNLKSLAQTFDHHQKHDLKLCRTLLEKATKIF